MLSGERFYAAVVSASLAPGACPGAAGGGREHFTGDDELVFPGEAGGYLDGSALRRRHARARERAGRLRQLRFRDPRQRLAGGCEAALAWLAAMC